MRTALLLSLGLAATGTLVPPGAAGPTARTLSVAEGARPASAGIAELAWIAGHWRGEALGGVAEEIWSEPRAGAMMGMFRLVKGDSVAFYEIMTLSEEAGSGVLRLRHFHPDLRGWEERDDVRVFRLVRVTPEEVAFEGMTFRREGPDALRVFLAVRGKDGSLREEEFVYRRVARD